jgi:hypothetical protein
MEAWMEAQNGGLESQNGGLESQNGGLESQNGALEGYQIRITSLRSRTRIRIRIKVKKLDADAQSSKKLDPAVSLRKRAAMKKADIYGLKERHLKEQKKQKTGRGEVKGTEKK